MPYRRKDSSVYWTDYTDASGKRVRRSTGTRNRREAEALEAKWRLEVHQQSKWGAQPARTFEELMVEYLKETQDKKRSADRDKYATKRLLRFFAGRALHEIRPATISEYKRARHQDGVQDGTIAKELRLLSAALNHARREWEWDVENPVQGRVPKEPPGRVRWITKQEAGSLVAASQSKRVPWLVDFIQLGLSTGMRKGEMLGLEWSRVDLGRRLIYLNPVDQKNGTHGTVFINESAREVLVRRFQFTQKHCSDSPWVFCGFEGQRIQNVRRSFATACRKAGITNFTPHDLRHTFAAWAVQKGVPIRTLCAAMRHRDIDTTMRYAHLAEDNVREAFDAVDGFVSRFRHGAEEGGVRSRA